MASGHNDEDFQDEDDILMALEREEDDENMSRLREQRMEQLKREMENLAEMRQNNHGTYETVRTEKDLMKITTSIKHVVVHFFHKEFRRCLIMDKHMEILAKKHFRTKFVKIDVENAPFLVERMKIQVLPCIMSFVDGVSQDRLIGFEELGNNDNFTTAQLEKRLTAKSDVIKPVADKQPQKRKTIMGFAETNSDDDD